VRRRRQRFQRGAKWIATWWRKVTSRLRCDQFRYENSDVLGVKFGDGMSVKTQGSMDPFISVANEEEKAYCNCRATPKPGRIDCCPGISILSNSG
jgi:hypothetical protein